MVCSATSEMLLGMLGLVKKTKTNASSSRLRAGICFSDSARKAETRNG